MLWRDEGKIQGKFGLDKSPTAKLVEWWTGWCCMLRDQGKWTIKSTRRSSYLCAQTCGIGSKVGSPPSTPNSADNRWKWQKLGLRRDLPRRTFQSIRLAWLSLFRTRLFAWIGIFWLSRRRIIDRLFVSNICSANLQFAAPICSFCPCKWPPSWREIQRATKLLHWSYW